MELLVGHSCRILLWDSLVGHSSGTLLRDTLVGFSSSFVLQGRQFSASSSTGQIALSPAFRALNTHDLRRGLRARGTNRTLACISRTPHARAEGCARVGQIALSPAFRALDARDLRRGLRAHGTNRTLACIWCTRHARSPQRVARQVSKTSVSYETSSKSHVSSLQNERVVRDFLQKSSGNTHRSTHITQPCQAVSRVQPLQTTPVHTPIPMGQRHSPLPQLTTSRFPAPATNLSPIHTSNAHKVLRLPRNVTSLTSRNLTIPCACHENCTSTLQSPHEVLRLPRKVTISSHVSFNKICTTPHVWNDFDPFRAHSHPSKSPFQLRLVAKTELRRHTLKRKSQWHGHIQHPKNTTLQTLIPMELRRNLRISQNAAPVQRSASRFLRDMSVSRKSQWNSGAN